MAYESHTNTCIYTYPKYIIYCNTTLHKAYDNLLILHFRQNIKTLKITVIFYLNHFFWYSSCLLSPLLLSLSIHSLCAIKNEVETYSLSLSLPFCRWLFFSPNGTNREKKMKKTYKRSKSFPKRVSKKITALASWKSETCCWTLLYIFFSSRFVCIFFCAPFPSSSSFSLYFRVFFALHCRVLFACTVFDQTREPKTLNRGLRCVITGCC